MTEPTHLDGNSIGGLLYDVFGQEMTARLGCCGQCGSVRALAEVHVYREAPGDVVRCPDCGIDLFVIVTTPSGTRVGFGSLRWVETPR